MEEITKICQYCGKEYVTDRTYQKYCSSDCRQQHYNRKRIEKQNPWSWQTPKICEVCGKEYLPKSTVAKYCSETCRIKAKKGEQVSVTKICGVCGKEFTQHDCLPRKYCSSECRRIANIKCQRIIYARERRTITKKETMVKEPNHTCTRKNCVYAGRISGVGDMNAMVCGYLLITGTPRGCDGGEACDKYKPRGKAPKKI